MADLKLTYANLHEATQHDIRKTCKVGYGKEADRKLEESVRKHLDGANQSERRDFYNKFYGRR